MHLSCPTLEDDLRLGARISYLVKQGSVALGQTVPNAVPIGVLLVLNHPMQVLDRCMLLLGSGAVLLLSASRWCVGLIDLLHHVLFVDARKLQRNAGDALFEVLLCSGDLA